MKRKLAALLAACLTLSLAVLPASALTVEDGRKLLQEHYVEEIPPEILEKDTLDEILEALGDPYTYYMSAAEYQRFLNQVNGEKLTGIGVAIERVYREGYQIMSVLPNSPAKEAGLVGGDVIVAVDGLTVTAETDVQKLISGAPGTQVNVTIRRADGTEQTFALQRKEIVLPIVTYELRENAGFIDCDSFGTSTAPTMYQALKELGDQAATWIIDMRENGGGAATAAADSVTLFQGNSLVSYFRDKAGDYYYVGSHFPFDDMTDQPVLILTGPDTASGAEQFTAAARDYRFGLALGQRTFGKGIAQVVLSEELRPDLFHGDSFKITAYRFFSPRGATVQTVGVIPALVLPPEQVDRVSMLLSEPKPEGSLSYARLELFGQTLYLDLRKAQTAENREAFTALLEALPPAASFGRGLGGTNDAWEEIAPEKLARELGLDFHSRGFSDLEGSDYQEEIETLAAYELLEGFEDGTFRPEQEISRAEFCAMVTTALGLPMPSAAQRFTDVPGGSWYYEPVTKMAGRGFIAGLGDGSFHPDDTISYEELATMLAAVADWVSMDGHTLNGMKLTVNEWAAFQDFAPWAQVPVRNLSALGIAQEEIAPSQPVTRQLAAGMLCRLMEELHLLWQ